MKFIYGGYSALRARPSHACTQEHPCLFAKVATQSGHQRTQPRPQFHCTSSISLSQSSKLKDFTRLHSGCDIRVFLFIFHARNARMSISIPHSTSIQLRTPDPESLASSSFCTRTHSTHAPRFASAHALISQPGTSSAYLFAYLPLIHIIPTLLIPPRRPMD
jgi:hypothetical protein